MTRVAHMQDQLNWALIRGGPPYRLATTLRQILPPLKSTRGQLEQVKALCGQVLVNLEQRLAVLVDSKSLLSRTRPDTEPRPPVLQEVEELGPHQERELACAVAVLWDEFLSDMGGPGGFTAVSEAERESYIVGLRHSADQVRSTAGSERRHYALAPELMADYTEALAKIEHTKLDKALAAVLADLATRGHLLRKAARNLHSRPKLVEV